MVLSRVGPALWLTIQGFAWGTVATSQVAIHNLTGFYVSRFFLGMWEAGYLAACLSILGSFYTRREMAMRVTIVYVGNYFSSGVGGLIAGGIFKMPESTGLKQWQVRIIHYIYPHRSLLRLCFPFLAGFFETDMPLAWIVAVLDRRTHHLRGGFLPHSVHATLSR